VGAAEPQGLELSQPLQVFQPSVRHLSAVEHHLNNIGKEVVTEETAQPLWA
jgi:hypothetical protein